MSTTYRHASVVIGIVGLGIWGLWTVIPGTPAAQDEAAVQVTLSPTTAQIGTDVFTIRLTDASGQPVDGATIAVDINMTTMNMGKQSNQAIALGNGQYAAVGQLLMGGSWKISTVTTLSSGETTSKDFVVTAR